MNPKGVTRQRLYIDGMVLAQPRMSGIGHLALNMVASLLSTNNFVDEYDLIIVIPFNKIEALQRNIKELDLKKLTIKKIWLHARGIELLSRVRLLPPVDLFLGTGSYLFINYRNWPLLRSRSITYVHDVAIIRHPEYGQPKNQAYLARYLPLWIKRTDKILTLSEFSKSEIIEVYGVSPDKIAIVHAGSDMQRSTPQEIADAKKKNGITKEYLLAVGNIEPRKNIYRLFEAYALTPESFRKKYAFVLIGAESWLNGDVYELIAKLTEQGNAIYVPDHYIPDEQLQAIISGATALIHPALYEGFGIPPVEAMACGVPVALSSAEPMPEIAGGAALLFDPYDVGVIKDALVRIAEDVKLRNALIERGLKRSKELTWSVAGGQLLKVLEEAM